MAILTRDQILQADDLPREVVPVPEWGGEVLVRALTGKERDEFEAGMVDLQGGRMHGFRLGNLRAKLVSMTLIDEQGKRLFSSTDVERLGQKSAAALQRVFEAAQRLSGLTQGDVEALVKNSNGGQPEGSPSG